MFWEYFKVALLSLYWKYRGTFLPSLLGEPGRIPGGKTNESMEDPRRLDTSGVLSSQDCPHWTSSILTITYWYWLQLWFLLLSFCSAELWFSVSATLSHPSGREQFALWPQFSDRSKRSSWLLLYTTFCVSEEGRDDLQASHKLDQNSKILWLFLRMKYIKYI